MGSKSVMQPAVPDLESELLSSHSAILRSRSKVAAMRLSSSSAWSPDPSSAPAPARQARHAHAHHVSSQARTRHACNRHALAHAASNRFCVSIHARGSLIHTLARARASARVFTRTHTLSIQLSEFVGVKESRALLVDLDVRAHLPMHSNGWDGAATGWHMGVKGWGAQACRVVYCIVRACVRACLRACVRAGVRGWVRAGGRVLERSHQRAEEGLMLGTRQRWAGLREALERLIFLHAPAQAGVEETAAPIPVDDCMHASLVTA